MAKGDLAKIVACYREVFGSPSGKIVLEDMRAAWMNHTSHVPGDPYETAFREGKRSVVLRIGWMLDPKLKIEDLEREDD